MLKENKSIFDLTNLTEYHVKGYTGQGIKIAVIGEPTKRDHEENVFDVLDEICPRTETRWFEKSDAGFHAAIDWGPDIINLSYTGWIGVQDATVQKAYDKGIVLCISAGNSGELAGGAKDPRWISVGAVYLYKGEIRLQSYSGKGDELDCVMFIPYIQNSGNVFQPIGTSFSMPMLVGMLACYMSATGRKLNTQQALELIRKNCKDLGDEGHDPETGYGLFVLPKLEKLSQKITMDVPATIINGRFCVVARYFVEALGGTAEWNPQTGEGKFKLNGKTITLKNGSMEMMIEG